MTEQDEHSPRHHSPSGVWRLALPGVVGFSAVVLVTVLSSRVDDRILLGNVTKVLYPLLALAAVVCAVMAIRRYISRIPRSRGFATFVVVILDLSFSAAALFLLRVLFFGRS